MNKVVLLLGVVSLLIVVFLGIYFSQAITVILSILTSIVAATVFFYFQVYLPDQRNMKKAKIIFTAEMIKLIKKLENKHFFLVDLIDGEDIFIQSKFKFYKYPLENGTIMHSYFNYQDDLANLCNVYHKLVDIYGDYCLRYGTEKEEETYLDIKFNTFFEQLTSIFNCFTDKSIYPARIVMKEYKENIAAYEKNIALIADFINYNLINKSYDKLNDSEISDYISKMQIQITQHRFKMSIPYLYSDRITPNIYFDGGWYRILDTSDYINSTTTS